MDSRIGKAMLWVVVALGMAVSGIARAAQYVVGTSAPGAADTNPGTEEKPWKTVQHAADVAKAGDMVCVMEGAYPERVTLKNSGAEGKLITFRSCPRRGAEVYGFATGKADYVRIEGFRIHSPKPERPAGIEVSGNHVEALDNYLYDLGSGIHPAAGAGQDAPTDVRLAYNELYQVQEGIWLGGTKWVVENSYIHRAKWWGVWGDADYTRPFGSDHVLRYNCMMGSKQDEIGKAHLDCFQFFDDGGGTGKRIEVGYNVLYDFHQMLMGEMHKPDTAGDWTFHHNIVCSTAIGAWGICDMGIPRLKSLSNTFYGIKWYGVGINGELAEGGVIQNCIFQKIDQAIQAKDSSPQRDHNIFFQCGTKDAGQKDRLNMDPRMTAPEKGNFRLQRGSPAIGTGEGNVAIGALEYPNVYYVDPRHPAATDEGFGYAGQPYKTLAKALDVAQAGETIVVRGGVIRETLKARSDGVTVCAMKGEKVTISGADAIEGWKREAAGWSAPLSAEPKKVLRDGQPWSEFAYDQAAKRIVVKAGGDPRLHLMETVVREQGIDLNGKKDVKVEDITAVNTLK